MYCNQQITDTLFWTGVNDRRKQLFENLWPLPGGVSYNSFLIRDQKCALMDTVEAGSDRGYLDWIGSVLGDRPLDYLIIHHMELDHSGEIENLLQRYPDVKIVGNVKTFKVLCGYLGPVAQPGRGEGWRYARLGASSAEVYFHSVGALARNDE